MRTLLFLTNGHGEDLVAAKLIEQLKYRATCWAFPLVGEGEAFNGLGIKVLGSRKRLPSGGFSLRNFWFLINDLLAGLIGSTIKNIHLLESLKGKADLVIAIGDIVPIVGALFTKNRYIFVGVNKSAYYKTFGYNYTPWERWLLKNTSQLVFTRDEITKQDLKHHGIKAEYVGNPLMDGFTFPLLAKEKPKEELRLGLLPGTRSDAQKNLDDFIRVIEELIVLKEPDTIFSFVTATSLAKIPLYIQNISFNKVLEESTLILGLSGTGNEQAAGCGIPVVAFYGRGSQYNKKFAEAQKELLGDALSLVKSRDHQTIAATIWRLFNNPNERRLMGESGRERLGKPGAIKILADYCLTI